MNLQIRNVKYLGRDEFENNIDIYQVSFSRDGREEQVEIEMRSKEDGTTEFVGVWDGDDIGGAQEYQAANDAVENGHYATMDEAVAAFSRKAQKEFEANRALEEFLMPRAAEIEAAVLPHHDRIHPEAPEKRRELTDNDREAGSLAEDRPEDSSSEIQDEYPISEQTYDIDAAIDEAMGMMAAEGYYEEEPSEPAGDFAGDADEVGHPFIAPGPDGQHFALVEVPDYLAKEFPVDTLKELGVNFDNDDSVAILKVKIDGDEISLDRQYEPMSYADRFETAIFNHYRTDLEQEVARRADAEKSRIESSISIEESLDFREPDSTQRHLTIRVDDKIFGVVASYDKDGRVAEVALDPSHNGDPQLTELLASAKEVVVRHAQQYHDTDEQFLQVTGWGNSSTREAGYCVIPGEEIDRMGAEATGSDGNAGLFQTAEGYPIRLDFDQNANIVHATIPGTLVSLNPVLEGSRAHFVEAKAQLADHGIVLSKAASGDYQVDYHPSSNSYRKGEHGSVRFTDTIREAVEVGKQMAVERDLEAQSDRSGPERQAA